MGSLIDRWSRFLNRKAEDIFKITGASILGGKYVMMEDNPEEYIQKGLLYNPDVAAVIGYITKVALRVPWVLKKGDTIIDKHEIYDIWDRGNPVSRGSHIQGTAIKQFLATGNTFIYGIAPDAGMNAGRFQEFWNLPYDLTIEKGDASKPILNYINKSTRKKIPYENVLHWKTENPEGDGYFGTSPLKAGRLLVQQSNDSYLANAKSLQNLGVRGLLMRENLDAAGPEKAKKLSADLQEQLGGSQNFGKIPIAGGKYDYINFAVSPVDLALLDSQIRSRQGICNIYNFPSELLNDKEASTYNNMESVLKRLYTDVEIPLLEDLADIVHEWWVKKWGEDFSFRPDWSGIEALQKNKKELAELLSTAWWISAERKAEIMGETTELKGYYIPMGIIPEGEEIISTDEAIKQYTLEGDRAE